EFVGCLGFSPDGARLSLVRHDSSQLLSWNTESGTPAAQVLLDLTTDYYRPRGDSAFSLDGAVWPGPAEAIHASSKSGTWPPDGNSADCDVMPRPSRAWPSAPMDARSSRLPGIAPRSGRPARSRSGMSPVVGRCEPGTPRPAASSFRWPSARM